VMKNFIKYKKMLDMLVKLLWYLGILIRVMLLW
jgi:hypothetical protein